MKVKIPRNIKKYETKLIGGLSVRSFIFVIIGFAFAISLGLLLKGFIPLNILCLICILFSLPIFLMGILKISDLYLNEILIRLFKNKYKGENKRLYKVRGYNDEKK